MEIKITRSDDTFSSQELKEHFERLPNWDQSIALRVEQQQSKFVKTMDPSVLVAIFTLVGTSLGALITGLLQILQEKHKEKIVLVTKSGLRIEIEARNAKDKIPDLIKLLQTMEVDIIRI